MMTLFGHIILTVDAKRLLREPSTRCVGCDLPGEAWGRRVEPDRFAQVLGAHVADLERSGGAEEDEDEEGAHVASSKI